MNIKTNRFLGIILVIGFIISAVISTTLSWQHINQVTLSQVMGQSDIGVPVELILREKIDNERIIGKEIPNATFYLFTKDGEQIGGRYLTDENGKINVTLTKGEYYFEEITPAIGYTFDEKDGEKITKYPFTVEGKLDENVVVESYNRRLEGSLLVQNTVENSDGSSLTESQRNQEFIFTITFSDGGTYEYSVDNGETKSIKSGETFILKHAQTAVFDELSVGVLYNITQTPVDGYVIESNGHRGHITEDGATAEFTNIYQNKSVGSITITKEVIGENADLDKQFNFTLTIGEKQETFTLTDGETKTFSDIPNGTEYVVTEEDLTQEGYISTTKEYVGKINKAEEISLPFVNIYDEQPEGKTGSITVSKEVIGEEADLDKEFTFEIKFNGENAPENTTFKLKANEEKTFENIPYGVTYTVKETDSSGYNPVFESSSGSIAGEQTIEVKFQNIVPEKSTVKLAVTKELKGEYLETDEQKEFEFVLLIDGVENKFTLKADETKEFDLPVGSTYEIREADYFSEGYAQEISNGNGIAGDKDIQATVTNTYVGEVKTLIEGEKTWKTGDNANVTLPETITIKLKHGDLLYEEQVVKPDEKGDWKYSFIAPKYDKDGDTISYSVEEATVTSFIPTYDEYDITNTYIEPIKVTLPTIEKAVKGEDIPKAKFEFVLKTQNNAPLPEDSENNRKIVSINGKGKVKLGNITFTNPGVYTYTISELNGGVKGWKYDETIYTVTITITEEDGVLDSEIAIKKDKKEVEKIVFTNTYDQSLLGENVIVSGQKSWNHGNNPKDKQPKAIIVNVYGNGKLAVQKQVTASDNWKYSFELPKYDKNGKKIEYTVDEVKVGGYTPTIDGYDITNKYVGETDGPGGSGTSSNPQTGDNITFWFALMIISGTMLVIYFIVNRRKGKH